MLLNDFWNLIILNWFGNYSYIMPLYNKLPTEYSFVVRAGGENKTFYSVN